MSSPLNRQSQFFQGRPAIGTIRLQDAIDFGVLRSSRAGWAEATGEPAREDARPTEMPNCTAPDWLRLLFGLKRYNNRLWAWRFSITAQT